MKNCIPGRRKLFRLVAAALALLVAANVACAHEGPPFPIIVDEPAAGYVVSVWADPDIGTGTFYVMTDRKDGSQPDVEPEVEVWVQPVDKRLPKTTYPAEREDITNRMQFAAYPEFDRQDMWTVGILVARPGETPTEMTTEVKATPPGGPWFLLLYLVPFVMFGGLWAMGLARRWRSTHAVPDEQSPDEDPVPEDH